MDYQRIDLPADGFCDGDGGPIIEELEVAIGERQECSTDLHVRGFVHGACTDYNRRPFAGATVLREGRDGIDHDIAILYPGYSRCADSEETIALAVHLALDAHASELLGTEMDRICGE